MNAAIAEFLNNCLLKIRIRAKVGFVMNRAPENAWVWTANGRRASSARPYITWRFRPYTGRSRLEYSRLGGKGSVRKRKSKEIQGISKGFQWIFREFESFQRIFKGFSKDLKT